MTEKMAQTTKYPFCALVGQEMMKEAIVLNMIDPGLGGVLIRGQKGTAKTTAVRGIPDLMPDMKCRDTGKCNRGPCGGKY